MAGYEFVDRIKQRRIENEDRARQQALQERQDTRAQQAFDINKQDHARNLQRQNDEDLAHMTGAILLARGGVDKMTPEDRAQLVKSGRAANAQWQNLSDDEVWQNVQNNAMLHDDRVTEQAVRDRQLLEKEGAYEELLTSMNTRTNQIRGVPAQGAAPGAATAPPSNGATAPQGLAQQGVAVARTQVPSDVVTQVPGSAATRGRPVAAPAPISKELPTRTMQTPRGVTANKGGRGITNAELSDEVAKDPLAYASSWTERRNDVTDQTRRSMTDARVFSAVQEDLDAAKADYDKTTDPRTKATLGRRMVTRDAQLQALAKARGDGAIDAVAARGAPTGDRAAGALAAAAKAYGEGKLPVTQEQLRGLQTTANRAAEGKTTRFSPLQIKRLAHATALGLISPEQAENLMKHGSMEKPEKPTVQPLGDGYAAIVTQNGVSLMQLPGAGKSSGGGGAESAAQSRLLANDRLEQAYNYMKETFGKDEAQAHMNAFLQTVKREGANLTNRTGVPLLDPRTGAFNPGLADPGEMAYLLETYVKYDKGEVNEPWYMFKGGRSFTDYAAETAGPAAGGNTGGWTVTPVAQ
jgi:hypothetical protein